MSNIIPFQIDTTKVRMLGGKISVYDVIEVAVGHSGQRKAWKRLCEQYPEVNTKCIPFRFPGKGQRLTPVTNREGILYIIGLLPGELGKKFRKQHVQILLRYLDADLSLVENVIQRSDDKEGLQKVVDTTKHNTRKLTENYE